MRFISLILLLTIPLLFAQEKIYLKACSDQHLASELSRFAQSLASPLDQVDMDSNQNCIDIFTSSTKEDLFRRGLTLKFGNIQIDSVTGAPSTVSGDNQCQLQFFSEANQNTNDLNGSIEISKKLSGDIYAKQVNISDQQSAMLLAGPIKSTIIFDMHSFSASCRKSNNGAEVELEVSGPSLNLKNSLFLNSNGKQFLGEISRNNNKQNKRFDTQNLGATNLKTSETRKIYLQLR
jgi:hypothetical protein